MTSAYYVLALDGSSHGCQFDDLPSFQAMVNSFGRRASKHGNQNMYQASIEANMVVDI